jgi:type I restriction enzyme, S subunit
MNAEQLLQHFERISEAPDALPRLRRFILDLAVRGKLLEQDPSEETAAELLKGITAEKSQLMKAGKIKREKPLPPLSESDKAFEVPNGWEWVRLGDLTMLVTSGSRDWAKHYSNDGAIFVRMGNLSKDHYRLRLDHIQRVKAPADGEGTRTRLEPGDILISITGEVGMLGLIPDGFGEAYINQHTAMVRPLAAMKGRYLAELFRSQFAQAQFNEPQRGIKNSFRLSDMTQFVVPLPPLAEQHRIVAKVDELMSLCDQLDAAKAEREKCRDSLVAASLQGLNQPAEEEENFREHARFTFKNLPRITTRATHIKQLRQTILGLAVRGKLVEQDPSDEPAEEQLARIMEAKMLHGRKARATKRKHAAASDEVNDFHLSPGWATAPLADLVTVLNGRAYKQSELLDAGTPVLRVGNLFTSNKWYYSDLELDDDKYCDHGDLIFSWSASFGPFIWNGGRTIYHYHIWKLPLHSPDDLSRDYLLSLSSGQNCRNQGCWAWYFHGSHDQGEDGEVGGSPSSSRRAAAHCREGE